MAMTCVTKVILNGRTEYSRLEAGFEIQLILLLLFAVNLYNFKGIIV